MKPSEYTKNSSNNILILNGLCEQSEVHLHGISHCRVSMSVYPKTTVLDDFQTRLSVEFMYKLLVGVQH